MAKDAGFLNNIILRTTEMIDGTVKHLEKFNDVPVGQRLLTREQQVQRYRALTREDWQKLYQEKGPEEVGRYIQAMERLKK